MSTTHHVKMAKASQADIDAAIELYQFLQAMSDGGRASDAVAEFGYTGYGDLVALDADDVAFVLRAHERGGLFRVVWGLQVLLDPANEVVDPNLPHLELHPKHEQAARERDEARAELARLRTEFASSRRAVGEKHTHEHLRLAGVANHDEGRTCGLCGGDVPSGFKHEHGAGVCTAAGLPPRTTPDEVAGTPATSDDRGGPDDGAPPAPPAVDAGGGGVSGLDLVAHLRRQRDFSLRTFGPGPRSAGVVDHIRKELLEIEAAPSDLAEWIDVVILAFDGAWRIGATPEQIVAALLAKQAKNEARTWPNWRKADPSKAIEHDRSRDGGGA